MKHEGICIICICILYMYIQYTYGYVCMYIHNLENKGSEFSSETVRRVDKRVDLASAKIFHHFSFLSKSHEQRTQIY